MVPSRLAVLVGIAMLSACGGGGGSDYDPPTAPNNPNPPAPPSGPSTTNQITVQDNSFNPSSTTVSAGTTVTWTWSNNYNQHDVTFNDGSGTSGPKSTGTYERTFATAATYAYTCSIHGSGMSGTVVVTQ